MNRTADLNAIFHLVVCWCVCIYTHKSQCIHIYKYLYIYMYIYTYIYICIHTCIGLLTWMPSSLPGGVLNSLLLKAFYRPKGFGDIKVCTYMGFLVYLYIYKYKGH